MELDDDKKIKKYVQNALKSGINKDDVNNAVSVLNKNKEEEVLIH